MRPAFALSAAVGVLLAGCRPGTDEPAPPVAGARSGPLPTASASEPLPPSTPTPSPRPPTSAPTRATLASRTFDLDDTARGDCALDPTGAVHCWSPTAPLVAIAGLNGADSLVATAHFTCARTKAGVVQCWGRDPFRDERPRLGLFDAATTDVRPGRVRGLGDDVDALSAGGQQLCARRRRGALRCASEDSASWVSAPDALAGTQGGSFDCSLRVGGALTCAIGPGENDEKGFGRVSLPGAHTGLALMGWGVHGDGAIELCVLDAAAAVRCYDGRWDLARGVGRPIALPRPAVQLAAGMHHACALLDDGSVQCWEGAIGRHDVPGPVGGLPEPAVEITVGDRHACARLASGRVACFGGAYTSAGAPPRVILGG